MINDGNGADRLTSETWYDSQWNEVYAFAWDYDAAGNRTHQWRYPQNEHTYYAYDAANALTQTHLLPADTHSYFAYDDRGNCLHIHEPDGTTYFDYNASNLVTRMAAKDSAVYEFHYDARGRRYAITWPEGVTYYTYDQDGLCPLLERDATGQITAAYARGHSTVAGIGDLVGTKIITGGQTYYRYDLYDQVGKLMRTLSPDGAITGRFEYDAWGNSLLDAPPPEGSRFGFSAPAWIRVADVYLSPTRFYDPATGLFLGRDARQRLAGSYAYARSHPIQGLDPTGRQGILSSGSSSYPPGWPRNINGFPYAPSSMVLSGNFLTLSYEFGDTLDPNAPRYTRLVTDYEALLGDMREVVGVPDRSGRCGKCIRTLYLTGHGSTSGGRLDIGGRVINIADMEDQEARSRAKASPGSSPVDPNVREKDFLRQMGELLCRGAKVYFVYCSSGKGPDGQRLKVFLEQWLGPKVTVVLYEGNVGWSRNVFGSFITEFWFD